MLLGALSSSGSLPYWATAGQYGLMPESSGALTRVQFGQGFDAERTFQWRWGASLAASRYADDRDPASSPYHPMVDELYGSVRWKALTLDLGQKRRVMDFLAPDPVLGSLSVTGGHLMESGNARSMPGWQLTLDPVAVPFTGGRVKIFGSYGDYRTFDNRYMKGALVHRIMAGLDIKITERLDFHGEMDH